MKKQKFFYLFLIFLGMCNTLDAQINLLKSEEFNIEAKINLVTDQLTEVRSTSAASLELKNGELDILFPLIRNVKDQFYNVSLEMTLNGQPIFPKQEELTGFYGENLVSKNRVNKRITWMNLIDNYQQLEGDLKIKIKTELRGKLELAIDCSNPPVFSKKEKMRYYIAGGVGVAAIGAGQFFRNQSDKIYEDDYLTSQTLEEAQPNYDKANSNHQTYLILTYAGTAIIVTDLVLYILRNRKHKSRMRVYKKFCNGNTLSVSPLIELPSSLNPQSSSGLQFTYTF